MSTTFRYKVVHREDGTPIKSPVIPVIFSASESFSTLALVDSGANVSAIPRSIAEAIGVDISGDRTISYGIGGRAPSVESTVKLSLKLNHKRYSFVMPIMVVLSDYQFPPLLGRVGFFSRFLVSFDETGEKITIKERQRGF